MSEAFGDDPLRVLRGFQFASRFDMTIAPETVNISRESLAEAATLPNECIWGEWEKWDTGVRPSVGLRVLHETDWLSTVPALQSRHAQNEWQQILRSCDTVATIARREGITGPNCTVLLFAALSHTGNTESMLQQISDFRDIIHRVVSLTIELHRNVRTWSDREVLHLAHRLAPATIRELAHLAEATQWDVGQAVTIAESLTVLDAPPTPMLQG